MATGPFYQGDQSTTVNILISSVFLLSFGTSNTLTYTIDLGRAGEDLNNVNFKIFDVDGEIGRF